MGKENISRREALKRMSLAAIGTGAALTGIPALNAQEKKGKTMKVLLINGSAHKKGTTWTALTEIAAQLKKEGVGSSIFQIGNKAVHGCIGCYRCKETGACVFQDDIMPKMLEEMQKADGIIIGSPVYYAGPSGALCAVLDRLFFSGGKSLQQKPAAAIVVCRRGGATASFDRLNKYFTISQMPVVSSQYWNMCYARVPEDLQKDQEGLQIMRTLAVNMAKMLKNMQK